MGKWKCEICGNEFENFHAQGFDNKIFCPLCFFKRENQELKKRLEYLKSGEYLNQLKFERSMLEEIVEHGEVSKEDKEFIDCTHRNTELLEENKELKEQNEFLMERENKLQVLEIKQKEFIKYMNDIIEDLEVEDVDDEELKGYLIQRIDAFKEISQKYKEIIGITNE